MVGFKYCCALPAFIALSIVTEVRAAGLYTTRCDQLQLTGPSVESDARRVEKVQIVPRTGTPPSQEGRRREHVQISRGLADLLHIKKEDVAVSGEARQIRVSLGSGSPIPTANFTVAAIDEFDKGLRLAVWMPSDLTKSGYFSDQDNGYFKLFGTKRPSTVFKTRQYATVHDTAPGTTVVVENGQATRRVHFVEPNSSSSKLFRECVEVRDTDLAVLVPHGGGMEIRISDELDALLSGLADDGYQPSAWEAAGQWGSGQTFGRWHITATQISGLSFPGYEQLASETYRLALVLHGYAGSERAVVMGGRTSRHLKCFLLDSIEERLITRGQELNTDLAGRITYKIYDATDDDPIDVLRDPTGSGDYPQPLTGVDDLSGTSYDNIVNRLWFEGPEGGIQLEMSNGLRTDPELFHEFMVALASALASALDEGLDSDPGSDYCDYMSLQPG